MTCCRISLRSRKSARDDSKPTISYNLFMAQDQLSAEDISEAFDNVYNRPVNIVMRLDNLNSVEEDSPDSPASKIS